MGMVYLSKSALGLTFLLPFTLISCGNPIHQRKSLRNIPSEYVQGSFVIAAAADSDAAEVERQSANVASAMGCELKKFEVVDWGQTAGVISEELGNTYNARFDRCNLSREETAAIVTQFSESSAIASITAEPISSISSFAENDPLKKDQSYLQLIKRDAACELSKRNAAPVVVAVIDTGVDKNHPDLQDMFYKNSLGEIVGANFVGSRSQMPADQDFGDLNGHGTHVAGLIAAAANNGQGIAGVGACVNVKIMPIRVVGSNGKAENVEIDRAIKWAADNGAHIINLSLGHVDLYNKPIEDFKNALFTQVANQDVVMFAAAGNNAMESGSPGENGLHRYYLPASYDRVISVAAVNNSGQLESYSNRGIQVDMAAPGTGMLSTFLSGRYEYSTGTSMATPVVSGVYAMALATAQAGLGAKDRLDPAEAEDLLKQAKLQGVTLPTSQVLSGGVIDAERLLQLVRERYPAAPAAEAEHPVSSGPVVDASKSAAFSFSNLKSGQRVTGAQQLNMSGVPQNTYVVYFNWGNSPFNFGKVYTNGQPTVNGGRWFLTGNKTLTAVAYDKRGRILAKTSIALIGTYR